MYVLFALLFFLLLLLVPVVIIKPNLVFGGRNLSRKKAGGIMTLLSIVSFIIAAILTPPVTTKPSVEGIATSPTPTPTATISPTPTPNGSEARVVKVVDGDTLTVSLEGKNQTIRVIGLDTPETVDPRKPIQCFGVAASNRAKELLIGKTVLLEADPTQGNTDKYSRLLRYVFLDNGKLDYGLSTISEGYGHEYTYDLPYKYQKVYKEAQNKAVQAKKGLWADNACNTPTPTPAKSGPTPRKTSIQSTKPTPTPTSQSATTNSAQSQTTTSGGYSGSLSGDKDCKDFATHAEAQSYFVAKGGSPSNNVDNLDSDHDGSACESLP